jgi:hypothetical protein
VKLQDGGTYHPSRVQEWTWQCWESFWADAAAMRRAANARLALLIDGDSQDGDHHGTTQIISGNLETQAYLAERVFGVPVRLRPERSYVVLGTEAHTGPGGSADSAIARHLKCDRDPDTDQWATLHLRTELNGMVLDVRHHGRTGTRPHTAGSALANLSFHIWAEHKLRDARVPDLAIRAHKHVFGDSGQGSKPRVVAMPAWQLKTSFGHQIAAESLADIGGVLVLIQPGGKFEVFPKLYSPALPPLRTM